MIHLLALLGVLAGVALTFALLAIAAPLIAQRYGIFIEPGGLSGMDLSLLAGIVGVALLLGAYPAWRGYRNTLGDGLSMRV